MIFNSVTYMLLLVLSVALYWMLPRTPRLWMILLASLTFYGFWKPTFLLVMMGSAATDYFAALRIGATEDRAVKRRWLALSLTVNLGLLLYFKYLLFFVDNSVALLQFVGVPVSVPHLSIILPLGISFYTFQTISYTVDVYRGFVKPERDFVLYACFVTYFPQLVAGPILRAGEVIYQLDRRPSMSADMFLRGLRRILQGLFLKVVLADNISPLVDAGFAQPLQALSSIDVWTLAFLFGLQIYCDFSAYSHIAIGSADLMGISFPENFDFPYMACSPREFWRRWHISLSSWIRDYLYLPLLGVPVKDQSTGGLETAQRRTQTSRNPTLVLFATWAIMGFWHGANWTFVLWGLYHAAFIAAYRAMAPRLEALPRFVRNQGGWLLTLAFAMLGWIAFRAASLTDALHMYAKVFQPSGYTWLGMREDVYLVAAVTTLLMVGAYGARQYGAALSRRVPALWFAADSVGIAVMSSLVFVFLRPISQFIYFQF